MSVHDLDIKVKPEKDLDKVDILAVKCNDLLSMPKGMTFLHPIVSGGGGGVLPQQKKGPIWVKGF